MLKNLQKPLVSYPRQAEMDSQVSGTGKNFTSPLLKPKKRKIFGREKGYKNAKITKRFILTEVMQVLKYLNPKLEIN